MVFSKLHASGIRGYLYYNWEPKKNDKLRLKCDDRLCLCIEKLEKEGWKKVGTVPTEFQKPFREFLSLGGTITVQCLSEIPRKNASNIKGLEIACVYTIKGPDSNYMKIAFEEIKSAAEEAAKTDKKISLEPGKKKQKDDSVSSEQSTSSASASEPVEKEKKTKLPVQTKTVEKRKLSVPKDDESKIKKLKKSPGSIRKT